MVKGVAISLGSTVNCMRHTNSNQSRCKVQKPSQVLSGEADTFPRNRIAYAAFSESKRRLPLKEFAQEPAPNRIPTSRAPDAAYPASNPSAVPSDLPEDTVTISNPLLRTSQNQSAKGGVFGVENSAAPETSSAAAGHYDLLNAKSNSNPSAVSSAQVKADGTPKTSKAVAAQASSVTAQEQIG